MTVAIAYNGGAYGTYLEWCLDTLCSNENLISPFTSKGNSHGYLGNYYKNIKDYVRSDNLLFARFHPRTPSNMNSNELLEHAHKNFDYVIQIHCGPSTVLLNVNNFYFKIWDDWWKERLKDKEFKKDLYQNWPILPTASTSEIPTWIKREILSFNLMPSWIDSVSWCQLDTKINPNGLVVTIDDILYNIKNTLITIQKFCSLDYKRSTSDLDPYHQTMLSLQQYTNQDKLCNQIIESTLTEDYFEWDDKLPLPSQAWIQWKLRNHGFEIQCNGLDIFPTNSLQLRELLYPI